MSDLRESGSIEQDADMIGLLYRSDYYAEDEDQRQQLAGQASLHLAKNRNGPTGDVPLHFDAELMRFITREPEKKQCPIWDTLPFPFPPPDPSGYLRFHPFVYLWLVTLLLINFQKS